MESIEQSKMYDSDVHPMVLDLKSLFPYVPESWRKRYELKRASFPSGGIRGNPNGPTAREDARTPDGKPGGSSPEYMLVDYLDRHNVSSVVLNDLNASNAAIGSPWGSTADSVILCAAFNDYYVDRWLSVDPRYRLAMVVPSRDPQAAAREIRRIGENRQIVAVQLPLLNILMGREYYYPIYEEATRLGLPIYCHVSSEQGGPMRVGGIPDSYVESHCTYGCVAEENVASLVFSGTLDRFSDLRVIFAEYGFAMVLPLLWTMDTKWKSLRIETPWVRRPPSEYVHDHIRFTTQPLPQPRDPKHLVDLIEMMGDDLLLFSSDYPHWDNDMPEATLRLLSEEAKARIFFENASKCFRR